MSIYALEWPHSQAVQAIAAITGQTLESAGAGVSGRAKNISASATR